MAGAPPGTNSPVAVIVGVTNGLFTLPLNFGASPSRRGRALAPARGAHIHQCLLPLSPRQRLTPTPYRITAGTISGPVPASQLAGTLPSASLGGTYPGAVNFSSSSGNSFACNGSGLTNVNAATLKGIPGPGFWSTNGDVGANPTNGAFLGTRDNLPLELWAYSERALRLEPHFISPNTAGEMMLAPLRVTFPASRPT